MFRWNYNCSGVEAFHRSWTRFWPLHRAGRRACSSPTGVLWLWTSCNRTEQVRGQRSARRSEVSEVILRQKKVYLLLYEMICCSISSLYKISALFCVTVTSWISSDLKMLRRDRYSIPLKTSHKTKRAVKEQVSQLLGSIASKRWTVGMAT